MNVTVIAFGKIAEITAQQQWRESGASSTEELRALLTQQYPALQNVPFLISVNRMIANTNMPLPEQAEVALLPPFSGG